MTLRQELLDDLVAHDDLVAQHPATTLSACIQPLTRPVSYCSVAPIGE